MHVALIAVCSYARAFFVVVHVPALSFASIGLITGPYSSPPVTGIADFEKTIGSGKKSGIAGAARQSVKAELVSAIARFVPATLRLQMLASSWPNVYA
jgi:hypothetical protein